MELWQIIVGVAAFLIAGIILNYCSNTRNKKGPILSSTYFALNEEERKFFDKDKEYERLTIEYGLIGIFFIFIGITAITLNKVFAIIAFIILLADLVFLVIKIIEVRSRM